MKAHIGKAGSGTQPLCGANIYRTSGYSTTRDKFMTLDVSFRCKRCAKKMLAQADKPKGLPVLERMLGELFKPVGD